MIPYGRQDISEEDIAAVVSVLRSPWLTQGPTIEEFERAVASYCGARFAVAVSSGTAALHVACLAAGLGPGQKLWTSPNTFVASANCALYCGAGVDFVDIDPRTYNMSARALEAKLAAARVSGGVPEVLVPVHFSGQPSDMPEIARLARADGVRIIIEDAAHAIGAKFDGVRVGACRHSDMAILSFHPVKVITTAEGGVVLTNRVDLYEKLKLFRTHGTTRDAALMEGESEGAWYYQQIALGFNYRLTDVHAALGLSQLRRIESFLARRRQLAKRYDKLLADLPLTLPWQDPRAESAWHLYVVRVQQREGGSGRAEVFGRLRERGIGVNVHYIPVHTQPYYRKLGFRQGDFPESERYYAEAISLPMYSALTDDEQDSVVEALRDALR